MPFYTLRFDRTLVYAETHNATAVKQRRIDHQAAQRAHDAVQGRFQCHHSELPFITVYNRAQPKRPYSLNLPEGLQDDNIWTEGDCSLHRLLADKVQPSAICTDISPIQFDHIEELLDCIDAEENAKHFHAVDIDDVPECDIAILDQGVPDAVNLFYVTRYDIAQPVRRHPTLTRDKLFGMKQISMYDIIVNRCKTTAKPDFWNDLRA